MALQASGSISASQIRNEFAGVTQVSFSKYFRHAEPTNGLEDFSETYTSANNSGIPTSGAIKFSDFYGGFCGSWVLTRDVSISGVEIQRWW